MGKISFHIYNVIILVLLSAFNCLVLFAFGIGEGGMTLSDWFPIVFSFIIWGIFYAVQFMKSSKRWRVLWFIAMVVLLYFWLTGLGSLIGYKLFR
ncbi:hypothetical protein SFC66_09250 [Terribacillus saccharophilus]|uniref:hypothetical protein n=1 Tax=Terribacillus saccharophilus TaxID=361277 RepID=UPI003982642D